MNKHQYFMRLNPPIGPQEITLDEALFPYLRLLAAMLFGLSVLLARVPLALAQGRIPRPELAVSATAGESALIVATLKARVARVARTLEISRAAAGEEYRVVQRVPDPSRRVRFHDAPAYDGRYRYRARVVASGGVSRWSLAAVVALSPSKNVPPRTPFAPGQRACSKGTIREVLRLVNRARSGLPPLKLHRQLQWAARTHTIEMQASGEFSHDGWQDYIRNSGFRGAAVGENIAYGYSSPASVMQAWLGSPGHRANILNPSTRFIGIGCVNAGQPWWTQDFGR